MTSLEISLSKEIISDHFGPIVEVIYIVCMLFK